MPNDPTSSPADTLRTLALGGGCHWCTEAVFQALRGVVKVDQGWIATPVLPGESEGVVVHYDAGLVGERELIEIHLHTHASGSDHSMRHRYRSALYSRSTAHARHLEALLRELGATFPHPRVTRVLPFGSFRESREAIRNYYRTDPDRPFCRCYIEPKLEMLRQRFGSRVKPDYEDRSA